MQRSTKYSKLEDNQQAVSPVNTKPDCPWPSASAPSMMVGTSVCIYDNDLHHVPPNEARHTLNARFSSWQWHCIVLLKNAITLGDAGPKAQWPSIPQWQGSEGLRAKVAKLWAGIKATGHPSTPTGNSRACRCRNGAG